MTDNSGGEQSKPVEPAAKRWLTVEQTAAYTGRTTQTIYNWINTGKLAASQPGGKGGQILVDVADIDRVVAPKVRAQPKKDGDT